MSIDPKVSLFVLQLKQTISEIRKRIIYRTKKEFLPDLVDVSIKNKTLWLTFSDGTTQQELTFPVPFQNENGNLIIEQNHVERACGTWLVKNKEYSYWHIMLWLLTERVEEYFDTKSKRVYIERILRSFEYSSTAIVFRNLQRIISSTVNKLPLVGTSMQAWAMCNRVQILDPVWGSLKPQEALAYQTKLNEERFPWTSLGQSDSGMCNNTILKVDVRTTVPFGLSHHNPRRNLYQTLGMTGDEQPVVFSESEKQLQEKGIVREGWNLMTAFVDLPQNFEDQIIVNERLKHLFVKQTKHYTCFGRLLVGSGDQIHFLSPLSIEPDNTVQRFDKHADAAVVKSIQEEQVNFNGEKTSVKIITIEYKRLFKDGFKLTNRHGNKGIIFLTDTGIVHDPVRGEVPIDVIVSAKSVMKRKNFGQLFEALTTLLNGVDRELVIKDNFVAHLDVVKESLIRNGYRKDGTLDITTRWGNFKAVCGWVHWGCIKTPEDQIWTERDTNSTNNRDLRTAGNKVSHIELRALTTIFGKDNSIIKEILKHQQGIDHAFDILQVLNTLRGEYKDLPVIEYTEINYINQNEGFFHAPEELSGTVADENTYPNGFYIKLPNKYKYIITRVDGEKFVEEFTNKPVHYGSDTIVVDKIMVPKTALRKPWRHQSGKYGLSDISALLNSFIGNLYKFSNGLVTDSQIGRSIYLYFHALNKIVCTKNGYLSNFCMSIRYPSAVKGTAALGEGLAPNEIEIHENMARDLKVKENDYVLVERFPCLGFMSLRVQRVRITNDKMAKYVIRVSGNSLTSQALDFDGDVLYIMSFHSPQSKALLKKEFESPHPRRVEEYKKSASRKVPVFEEYTIDDYCIEIFPPLTARASAEIVSGLTGMKRGTGTIVALCYNTMRILEHNIGYDDANLSIASELLLDKVANSVFSMKHAGRSLEHECREAICTADVEKMLALGFDPEASAVLAAIIQKEARKVGITSQSMLRNYFIKSEEKGLPSIINIIIKNKHKIWYTSRSIVHPVVLLENLERLPRDLPSWLFYHVKNKWEKKNVQNHTKFFADVGG